MLIIRTDSNGRKNAIATGRPIGRYKSFSSKNGTPLTEFTLCVYANTREKQYQTLKVISLDCTADRIIKYAKLNKEILVAFGNCVIDKEETDSNGEKQYVLYANALISPRMILETYEHHLNSLQLDKLLTENAEENIRYDYMEVPNIEDHRI